MAEPVRPINSAAAAAKATILKLKKGELLFKEGDNSRAMYLLKKGMIRIFKNRGDSFIEIDTIHSGQILGELAFLDGNPRSASGEALTDCELVEISGPTFLAVLGSLPDWLKALLKTIVGRLRAASTRIRQLESASTAYDYSDKDGGARNANYVYLSPSEILKSGAALLLVAARAPQGDDGSFTISSGMLIRYANQIMNVPVAKVSSFLDVMETVGVTRGATGGAAQNFFVTDMGFLEELIAYLNEENLLEPRKRHDISANGFKIMECIMSHFDQFPIDAKTGFRIVNMGEVKRREVLPDGRDPFRFEEFQELVKIGYATNLVFKGSDDAFTSIHPEDFLRVFRFQSVCTKFRAVNEQKRKGAA
ncbi:cyclic nucleotide-binding domain-containing protein [bacterium]|jgi:CRP-like cAMP-binding protein|nr:cyclic nucleotide-binding domain-containing protein [bacterium]